MCEWITDDSVPDHENYVLIATGLEVWPAWYNSDQAQWEFNDGPPARRDIISAWMEMPEVPSG